MLRRNMWRFWIRSKPAVAMPPGMLAGAFPGDLSIGFHVNN
jgi:hypothetical protein